MAIGGVVINFTARTTKAVQDVQKFTKELGKVDSAAGKTGKLLKKGLAVGAAAAGAALLGAGAAMVEFAQAAIEDYKSAQKLADTLATIPGITADAIAANEDWISSMQIATNVADTDLRNAIGKAALVTQDLGEAQAIAAAAADLAAINGKEYSTVADAMAKAAAGNTTQLKRMAPWLDVNKDGTLTFAEAMGELGTKYEEASEKAADRDPWERIKTIWGEIKESLGQFVIPLITQLGDWFKDKKNQKAIKEYIDKVADLSTKLGTDLVKSLQDVYSWFASEAGQKALSDFGNVVQGVADSIKALASGFETLARAYDKLPDWFKKLQGKAFEFVGSISLPGVLARVGAAPKPTPTPAGSITSPSAPTSNRRITSPSQPQVTINNYYPKPETASANLAASLRTARLVALP
jgi:hypothetical protein